MGLKLSYFGKKIQNFRVLAAPPPQTPQTPPFCTCLAPRLSLIMFCTANFYSTYAIRALLDAAF